MTPWPWPEEVVPPPYESALVREEPRFATAFCPECHSQVIGPDAVIVIEDLLAHVAEAHS